MKNRKQELFELIKNSELGKRAECNMTKYSFKISIKSLVEKILQNEK